MAKQFIKTIWRFALFLFPVFTIQAEEFVPPGFEALLEPQTTQVDIYYGSAYLVSSLATFTPSEITFLEPNDIASRIPDLLELKQLEAILAGALPNHSELVCLKQNQTDCGQLETQTMAVIFDANRFRADIFIAPQWLSVRSTGKPKFLPRSDGGLSLMSVVTATLNGEESRNKNYNFASSTTLAYRESRLLAIGNVTDDDKFTVDTLAIQREVGGSEYQAGYFNSNAGASVFLPQTRFLGLSIATSLDTRNDLDQSAGTSLQLFLNSRSRVDIFKDGRLMSTRVYETGNQIIDTSKLPGGAYDITLRIRNSAGETREESRFYAKTNRLPPSDQALYFIDIGEEVTRQANQTLPTRNGNKLLRAGVSRRLTNSFGGNFGLAIYDDEHLVETGMFALGRQYDVRLNFAAGADNSRGFALAGNYRLGRTLINTNMRRTWSDSTNTIIGNEVIQGAFTFTLPIKRHSFSLSARYNKRQNTGVTSGAIDEITRNYSFRWELPSLNLGQQALRANIQATKNNDDLLILLSAQYILSGKHLTTQVSSRANYEKLEQDTTGQTNYISNITTTWRDQDLSTSDITLSLRGNDDINSRSVEADLELASSLGRARFDVLKASGNENLNYGASLSTSIIATPNSISFGGKSQFRSAVIIDIAGDADDGIFDVNVNGFRRDSARAGQKTVVSLTPYDTYNISLSPKGDKLVSFTEQSHSATLYPGNVVSMSWRAERIVVAFGEIVDEAGVSIKNALLTGVSGLATTDDFGMFQAEMNSSVKEIKVKTRAMECTVEVPKIDIEQTVALLETLICHP